MTVGIGLEIRQHQALVLTPQLRQAIRLLQLPAHELQAAVQKEIAENPFLRLAEEERGGDTATSPARVRTGPVTPADSRLRLCSLAGGDGDDLPRLDQRLAQPVGLRDSLRLQIGANERDVEVRELARSLVDLLDADGYLREDDRELARRFGVSEDLVRRARAALQRCEPAGIGARDLAGCLALQLAERDRLDPAMERLLEHLDLVARGELAALERICGLEREDIEEMIRELRSLDPRPGAAVVAEEPVTLVPDLLICRYGRSNWRIEINSALLPKVLVDREWYAELAGAKLAREAREYLSERIQAANWLVRALEQRTRTLLRVARATFLRQRAFLEHGPRALRPLTLREIAETVELHESTVSRAVAGKYAATPHGTFPLKYFFSAQLAATDGGDGHSAEAVRLRIRELVAREDPASPLSDDQIVRQLAREGVSIARRTVAKYREALGIPSSVQRRRLRAVR